MEKEGKIVADSESYAKTDMAMALKMRSSKGLPVQEQRKKPVQASWTVLDSISGRAILESKRHAIAEITKTKKSIDNSME